MKANKKQMISSIDKFNLAAIKVLECIGINEASELQIQTLERLFRKLARNDESLFFKITMPEPIVCRDWEKIERIY